MPARQGNGSDAIRHVATQVDRLIDLISDGARATDGRAPAAADPLDGVLLSSHTVRLASILDAQELHGAIVQSATALTGAQRCFLTLVEEGHKLRFKSGHNIDQHALASPAFASSRGVIKQVLQEGRPVLKTPDSGGGAFIISVPLRFGIRLDGVERVGGAIYADSAHPLGENQLNLLKQLTEQASVAIENCQLFAQGGSDRSQVLRLQDNITKLYEVGQSISRTLILDELLVSIVDHVIEITRAQRGFIMLFEGEDSARKLRFKTGRTARKRSLNESHFQVSTTLAKKALAEKRSQIMTSAAEQDLSVSMVQMELQSILVTPLIEKEEVIGLVYVDSQQSNKEFDTSDQEIVESLCGQASIAIINAKLYAHAAERERLAHELEIAGKIQADLLPKEIPPVNGLQMHGLLYPALEMGGDYYDFIPHGDTQDSLTIAIGDVSGKGVGAGLVAAMCRSALRSIIGHIGIPTSPLPIMKSLNVMMVNDIPPGMFMTLNLLIWDAESGRIRYAPAGHEHLLVWRAATRKVEKIRAGGVACGVLKQASSMYKERVLDLKRNDHLLLYTDGVTEAMNEDHKEFTLDRTVKLVEKHGHQEPKVLCEAIYDEIVKFRGKADPHDDISMVALKVV